MGDYGGEILNEVKISRSEKELYATPATLHNGNHHKVQECKPKVNILWRDTCGNIDQWVTYFCICLNKIWLRKKLIKMHLVLTICQVLWSNGLLKVSTMYIPTH